MVYKTLNLHRLAMTLKPSDGFNIWWTRVSMGSDLI